MAQHNTELVPVLNDRLSLDLLLEEWLRGYRSPATRESYGDALGLRREWVRDLTGIVNNQPSQSQRKPPSRHGKFHDFAWLRWCDRHNLHPFTATSIDIKRWHDALVTAGMSKASRGHRLTVISEFYRFLTVRGVVSANPAAFDRKNLNLDTRNDTSSTVVLTAGQVDALLRSASQERRGRNTIMALRATAIIALFTLGIRVSELTGLRRRDLHLTRGRQALRIVGKGDKERVVYLSNIAADALAAYLSERDKHEDTAVPAVLGFYRPQDSPLITTHRGTPLYSRDVWALIRRTAAAAGPELADIANQIRPHALRHFYVTAAAEAGADLTHIQADVGHSSVDTTHRVYNRAARHPDRSAVDTVESTLLAARVSRSGEG